MILHKNQIAAINACNDESIKSVFVTGEGGAGKSEVLKHVILNKLAKDFIILAPTQSAAENVNGETIHSFFKIKPVINMNADKESDIMSFDLDDIDPSLVDGKIVAIDEASMLGKAMLTNIMARINPKKLILFGDNYQLDPILDTAVDWSKFCDKTVTLTHNYRVSDPLVKKIVTLYRNEYKLSKDIEVVNELKPSLYDNNTIYIAHTNKNLSNMQKSILGYSDAKKNDIVLTFSGCDKNVAKVIDKKGKKEIVPYFANNDLVKVLNSTQFQNYDLYICEVINLDNRYPDIDKYNARAKVMVGDYDIYKKITVKRFEKARDFQRKMLKKYKVKNAQAFKMKARKNQDEVNFSRYWRSYFEIKNVAYARHQQFRTVYKCQGKSFDKVVIDWKNLPTKDHKYVALSRARENIKIYIKG